MQKIPRQEDTAEFREQAVKHVKDGKTVGAVAKEMGPAIPCERRVNR